MVKLSPREREVVVRVGRDGAHYKTIARDLGISLGTVCTYVSRIMVKCGQDRAPREAMIALYYTEIAVRNGTDSETAD